MQLKHLPIPKQHSPFKISPFTLNKVKTDNLSDIAKESTVDTSEKSSFNDKEDTFNFTNADIEPEKPELIEIFKNSNAMKEWIPDIFNEKYHFFPISKCDTQEVAVTDSVETFKASARNKYLENPAEKNSFHDAILIEPDSTAASSPE
ncbi:hypothetical protein TNCT_133771 [Trichonephila clavata]|uniref:Uncharacterized protein n=1 Tax=Trichonephila clavata TaxID=2740835 RepID=A0A8X6LBS8_TRICU|nr:hypothetical protein TNCT_133771 [Trichonephila clavata]